MQYVRWAALVAILGLAHLVSGQRSVTDSVQRSAGTDLVHTGGTQGFVTASTMPTNPLVAYLPIANAGLNRTVALGTTVMLDGSASANPGNKGVLTYNWQLTSLPGGSHAALSNSNSIRPAFVADVPGNYTATLSVDNGWGNSSSTVIISTSGTAPVANAGRNQTVAPGSLAMLDGSGSFDVDGDLLTYQWTLVAAPHGSAATLAGATQVMPALSVDQPGTYVARLIVSDGKARSAPSFVTISTSNSAPVANAGVNQLASTGATVQLDGSGSTDVDGDALSYTWSLIAVPSGSTAALNSPSSVNPTFTVDLAGTYVAQLIVSDGKLNSVPSTVLITTSNATLAPLANAGAGQTVQYGSMVQLAGSATDPQGLQPELKWALISKPASSSALLSGSTIANPTFIADMPGVYVAQLIASTESSASAPSTVTIATSNTRPVANAGGNQSVAAGASVVLDGSRSSGTENDALTYSWSMLTRPQGSKAVLSEPNGVSPIFLADLPGTYVAQLIVHDKLASSNPVTVEITATATPALSLTLDSANLGLTRTMNGSVSLSAPATAGGVVVALTTATPGVALLTPSTVTIGAGSTTAAFTIAGVADGSTNITATAPGYTAASASVSVVNLGPITLPANLSVPLAQSVPIAVTLPGPAPSGGVVVTLGTGDPSKATVAPSTVNIAAGQSTPTVPPQVTGLGLGATTISVSAPGYTSANQTQVSVTATIGFSPASLTLSGNSTQNLALNLSAPAPGAGVTVNLTSDNISVATVPAAVSFSSGQASVNVPVTGVSSGSATIHASAPPLIADTTASITVSNVGTISLISSGAVAIGQTAPISVILSTPAPAPINVSLASSDTSKLTIFPPSVFIPQGSQIPVVTPQITGISLGSVAVIASAPNFAVASLPTIVFIGATFVPDTLTITGQNTGTLTLQLATPAPAGGLTVNLTSDSTGVATVPSTVTFAPNTTSVSVPVTGVAAGYTTIHASAPPNISDTAAAITILNPDGTLPAPTSGSGNSGGTSTSTSASGITLGNASVGQNLEVPILVTLPAAAIQAAGQGNFTLTLTSSDPTKLVLASSAGQSGSGTAIINVPAFVSQTQGNFSVWAQALAGSGTITVTAAANGFPSATSTVSLTPSGFTLLGPQAGVSTITTEQGVNLPLTVQAHRLDASFNVLDEERVRPGFPVTVTVTSSNPSVGTVTNSNVVFSGADEEYTTAQFTATGSGLTTVSANEPGGFSTPAQSGNALTITVTAELLSAPGNITLGKNLQTPYDSNGNPLAFGLNGITTTTGQMTITSNNPDLLLLSTNPNVPGSSSITLNVGKGASHGPNFYVQALASSGTATYTATMPGFGTATGMVTLAPSGFIISDANHYLSAQNGVIDLAAFVGADSIDWGITISPVVLDAFGNIVSTQPEFIGQGVNATLNLQNSNPSVASIASTATLSAGDASVFVAVDPSAIGYTTITLVQPPGFSTPAQYVQAKAEICDTNAGCPSPGN